MMLDPKSLLFYSHDIFSDSGTDGIMNVILELIEIEHGSFFMYGNSETKSSVLLAESGWSGAFVTPKKDLFLDYKDRYEFNDNIKCFNSLITTGYGLDLLINESYPHSYITNGRTIDVMAIHCNGLEYKIFETMTTQPKVLLLYGGMYVHPQCNIKLPEEYSDYMSQSLTTFIELAKMKKYEPIAFNGFIFFLFKPLIRYVKWVNQSPIVLWKDAFNFTLNDDERNHIISMRNDHFKGPLQLLESGLDPHIPTI